jgi:hypothetical protein
MRVVGADGERPREELLARNELFDGYFDVAPWIRMEPFVR